MARAEGELIQGVARIAHIPAVLVQGRLEVSSPPDVAWRLAQAWPSARLHVVPAVGHSAGGVVSEIVVGALDDFAARAVTAT
jgi:proline iminopeptidase